MAIMVVCHEPYEDCFETVVNCADRFAQDQIWLVDYGDQRASCMKEWLEELDLHGVRYVYRQGCDKFSALLKTAASLARGWEHILLVDTVIKSFPPSLNFDITFSGGEEAPCMKLSRRKAGGHVFFVWQSINALDFAKEDGWRRSLYIWERNALLACYYYSYVVKQATVSAPPPLTALAFPSTITDFQMKSFPCHRCQTDNWI
eukprot:scaffold3946_cov177-Amphora_coffeaeformis.AAC.24